MALLAKTADLLMQSFKLSDRFFFRKAKNVDLVLFLFSCDRLTVRYKTISVRIHPCFLVPLIESHTTSLVSIVFNFMWTLSQIHSWKRKLKKENNGIQIIFSSVERPSSWRQVKASLFTLVRDPTKDLLGSLGLIWSPTNSLVLIAISGLLPDPSYLEADLSTPISKRASTNQSPYYNAVFQKKSVTEGT